MEDAKHIVKCVNTHDELLAVLKRMTDYMVETHSATDEGVLSDLRDEHPSAWKMIDASRAITAKAEATS